MRGLEHLAQRHSSVIRPGRCERIEGDKRGFVLAAVLEMVLLDYRSWCFGDESLRLRKEVWLVLQRGRWVCVSLVLILIVFYVVGIGVAGVQLSMIESREQVNMTRVTLMQCLQGIIVVVLLDDMVENRLRHDLGI